MPFGVQVQVLSRAPKLQKPIKLIEKLMKIHSNEGDLILDPFMGSGTTAIASINTKCNYTGFELDNHYYKVLSDRIDAIKAKKENRIL